MILLGGDLFDKREVSKICRHECMRLIRKYCMGKDRKNPVKIEILSDQAVNFPASG